MSLENGLLSSKSSDWPLKIWLAVQIFFLKKNVPSAAATTIVQGSSLVSGSKLWQLFCVWLFLPRQPFLWQPFCNRMVNETTGSEMVGTLLYTGFAAKFSFFISTVLFCNLSLIAWFIGGPLLSNWIAFHICNWPWLSVGKVSYKRSCFCCCGF